MTKEHAENTIKIKAINDLLVEKGYELIFGSWETLIFRYQKGNAVVHVTDCGVTITQTEVKITGFYLDEIKVLEKKL